MKLCSLYGRDFWGQISVIKDACLFQARTVISVPICGNTTCMHPFTGQCTVDFTFLCHIRKAFHVYHYRALRFLGVLCQVILFC